MHRPGEGNQLKASQGWQEAWVAETECRVGPVEALEPKSQGLAGPSGRFCGQSKGFEFSSKYEGSFWQV